eukprot:TRINITY_DN7197_c0_g1_i1.p1 TRINITY_DN7197_c0_g1~~TRINITY_DN7197_c0_g1_i1.p1  ORF type:complete len:163 (+),score=39.29 TRINITY_DN7197_c0_g1_i1:62-550(+)
MKRVLPFYREDQPNGYLSQWYMVTMQDHNGVEYTCCEQYMMYQKALLFDDEEIAALILNTSSPKKMKALGRKVKGFNQEIWEAHRSSIVEQGNYLKFSQNEELKDLIKSTGDAILVEASPRDRIWGIGLGVNDPNIHNPDLWIGLNLLGDALMSVRERLNNE